MGAVWANVAVGAAVLLAGVSLLLAVVGVVSYLRIGHKRLLWVAAAFVGFLVQGVLLASVLYRDRGAVAAGQADVLPWLAVLNLGIVAALYLAVLKR